MHNSMRGNPVHLFKEKTRIPRMNLFSFSFRPDMIRKSEIAEEATRDVALPGRTDLMNASLPKWIWALLLLPTSGAGLPAAELALEVLRREAVDAVYG